jgi:hypothetical protein
MHKDHEVDCFNRNPSAAITTDRVPVAYGYILHKFLNTKRKFIKDADHVDEGYIAACTWTL